MFVPGAQSGAQMVSWLMVMPFSQHPRSACFAQQLTQRRRRELAGALEEEEEVLCTQVVLE